MDFLKAEIEKKRKRNDSLHSTEGSTTKKYVRQRDLDRKREEEYLNEQAEREKQRKVWYGTVHAIRVNIKNGF